MTYTFPVYLPATEIGVAIVAILLGVLFLFRRRTQAVSIPCFLVAAVAGGIFGPMLAMDRVVLDDEKLEQTTGLWFSPIVKGFELRKVASVRIGMTRDPDNREYEEWVVSYKDGTTAAISPGDLWKMNGEDIINRLRERDILVVDRSASRPRTVKPFRPEHGASIFGMNNTEPTKRGELLFQMHGCGSCHSTDGSRKIGPTLKEIFGETHEFADGSTAHVDETYVRQSVQEPGARIRGGYKNQMPTYRGRIEDAELSILILYLKSLDE